MCVVFECCVFGVFDEILGCYGRYYFLCNFYIGLDFLLLYFGCLVLVLVVVCILWIVFVEFD